MPKEETHRKVKVRTELGWDPLAYARECIENLKGSVKRCDSSGSLAYTGCIFANAEAAFYEKQINEDEMVSLKNTASSLRKDFVDNCKCVKR